MKTNNFTHGKTVFHHNASVLLPEIPFYCTRLWVCCLHIFRDKPVTAHGKPVEGDPF